MWCWLITLFLQSFLNTFHLLGHLGGSVGWVSRLLISTSPTCTCANHSLWLFLFFARVFNSFFYQISLPPTSQWRSKTLHTSPPRDWLLSLRFPGCLGLSSFPLSSAILVLLVLLFWSACWLKCGFLGPAESLSGILELTFMTNTFGCWSASVYVQLNFWDIFRLGLVQHRWMLLVKTSLHFLSLTFIEHS